MNNVCFNDYFSGFKTILFCGMVVHISQQPMGSEVKLNKCKVNLQGIILGEYYQFQSV